MINLSKSILLLVLFGFLISCAPGKYLGTKQTNLANKACKIDAPQCFMSTDHLSREGRKVSIRGSYKLESVSGGTYFLTGSAKLTYDSIAFKNIQFLDLTFIFFKGDVVVHEERIRLQGEIDKYHEFSKLIQSDIEFDSYTWAWYNWQGKE